MHQDNIQGEKNNKEEEQRIRNPGLFPAPKSIKEEVINHISRMEKRLVDLQKQINDKASKGETYDELTTEQKQVETQLSLKYEEFIKRMKEVFTKLKQYDNRNFLRFNDGYHHQNLKILKILEDLAKEFQFNYKTLNLTDTTIVIYKEDDKKHNFVIYLPGDRNANHPRNRQQFDQENQQEAQPLGEEQPKNTKEEQPKTTKEECSFALPPEVIRDIVVQTNENKDHTIEISFNQPEDYCYPIDLFGIYQLDMADLTLSLQPKKRIVVEFPNNKEFVQRQSITFVREIQGQNQLPFNEMIYLSVEARNKNGWSSGHGLSPIKLYLKYIEPRSLFIKGAINPDFFRNQDIDQNIDVIQDDIGNSNLRKHIVYIETIEQPKTIEILNNNYYLIEDFCEVLLEQGRIRSTAVKYDSVAVVNASLQACQWGKVLNFYDTNVSANLEVTEEDFYYSTPFQLQTKKPISKVACGAYHSLAVTVDGNVISWGYNNRGQLGNGTIISYSGMTISDINACEITYFKNNSIFVVDVQAGQETSMCRTDKGEVYCWGKKLNKFGTETIKVVNSFNEAINLQCLDETNSQVFPRKVNIEAKAITMGYGAFGAVSLENQIYLWGSNELAVFGFETCKQLNDQFIFHLTDPMRIDLGDYQIKEFQIGAYHCVARIVNNGKDYDEFISWGNDSFGQCGQSKQPLKTKENQKYCSINKMDKLPHLKFTSFSCGFNHTVFLTTKEAYTIGMEDGNKQNNVIKKELSFFANEVLAGEFCTLALGYV